MQGKASGHKKYLTGIVKQKIKCYNITIPSSKIILGGKTMKKLLAIILCLSIFCSFAACGEPKEPVDSVETTTEAPTTAPDEKQLFADMQNNLKLEKAVASNGNAYKNIEAEEVFLTTSIQNNSGTTIKDISVAFAAWDIDGNPIEIKSASGLTEDAYIKEVAIGDVTLADGEQWHGETEENVSGLRVAAEQSNIAYVESIVVSYTTEDGGNWTNPYYTQWRQTYWAQKLESWMKPANSEIPDAPEGADETTAAN